jgi:hypothetical protein
MEASHVAEEATGTTELERRLKAVQIATASLSPTSADLLQLADEEFFCVAGAGNGFSNMFKVDPVVTRAEEIAWIWREVLLCGVPLKTSSLLVVHEVAPPIFVDRDRAALLCELAWRLARLDAGKLRGQRNCFLVLGTKGVGKSTFLRALASANVLVSTAATTTIFVDYKKHGVIAPFDLIVDALRSSDAPFDLDGAASGDALRLHLMKNHKRFVLIIDEFEFVYKQDKPLADTIFRQMCCILDVKAERPVVVILTGSAAVLRSLVFCRGTTSHPHYPPVGTWNSEASTTQNSCPQLCVL